MEPDFMTIAVSLICSVIAAFVAHWLATNRMKKNELTKFKLNAYSEFIGAASKLAVSRRLGDVEDDIEELSLLNNAKNKILISAESQVLKELINFWNRGATLEKESELQAYRRLLQLMRADLGFKKNDILVIPEVSDFLFKLEVSSSSYRAEKEKYDQSR
ncbi:MAG: hypothetical protein D3914_11465 [Candidatus Electrothrix sp. LOE2]|nr:hypothetical protein [Candidatus Electrothrix sp. LOE2]